MIAIVTTAELSVGIGGWALWLIVRSQRIEHAQRRSNRLHRQAQNAHARDQAGNNGRRCASCGGELTALRWDNATQVNICADRELCRRTMIHENLLAQV